MLYVFFQQTCEVIELQNGKHPFSTIGPIFLSAWVPERLFYGWTRKLVTGLATWVRLRRKRKARRATADPFTKVSLNLDPCFDLVIGQLCLSVKQTL